MKPPEEYPGPDYPNYKRANNRQRFEVLDVLIENMKYWGIDRETAGIVATGLLCTVRHLAKKDEFIPFAKKLYDISRDVDCPKGYRFKEHIRNLRNSDNLAA